MSTKQQFATGFLALVIVASVAFMPVNATDKKSAASAARHSGIVATPLNSTELAPEQVSDLTYN